MASEATKEQISAIVQGIVSLEWNLWSTFTQLLCVQCAGWPAKPRQSDQNLRRREVVAYSPRVMYSTSYRVASG